MSSTRRSPPDARLVDRETGPGDRRQRRRDLVERYHARLAEWQAEIGQYVTAARRRRTWRVPSDLDLADLLFDVLRRRRVVE